MTTTTTTQSMTTPATTAAAAEGSARGPIRPAELAGRLRTDDAPRVVDVRTPGEFESVHIPGSYNVPLDTLREHREALQRHLDQEVVLVCASGGRARQAEQLLSQAGLPRLRVLEGGMQAWEQAGAEVRRDAPRWAMERQVRLVAGSLVATGVLASVAVPAARWVAGGVGAGLVFAAVTDTCAMARVLGKLPYNRGAACDLDTVVAQLSEGDRATGAPTG